MKSTISTLFFLLLFIGYQESKAQGCVAIRGGSCTMGSSGILSQKGQFQVGVNFRYFESFRHFRGAEEEHNRIEEGTQVINDSYFADLQLGYSINDRWFINANVPYVYHKRSSMYEHGGNPPNGLGERHETSSKGLGDIRLSSGFWIINPSSATNFNMSASLGVKLPTGNANYMDVFYNQGENRDEDVLSVVDQSIQPGDGGTALTSELLAFYALSHSLSVTANAFYQFGIQETNGVLTRNGRSEFSCPDQFAGRIGLFYAPMAIPGLSFYAGGRTEGVTASDVIGGDAGYRRPGYVISAEPGVAYSFGNMSMTLTIPYALYRNRIQSYEDKVRTAETGVYRHGDAAFADYLVNFNLVYTFGGKNSGQNGPAESFRIN